jgi:hypothetical protein
MFLSSDFAIFRSSVKTGVAQVFLEEPQSISGIINLHSVHTEGIPEPMWAFAPSPASFWVC